VLPDWISSIEEAAKPAARIVVQSVERGLHAVSSRTGVPVIVVAALAVVLAWRVGRRTWHVVFELALAFAVLFAATKLGWIPW
jgi:hypothetical protein